MSINPSTALAVTSGIAALIGGFAAWKIQKEHDQIEKDESNDTIKSLPQLSVEAIGKLLDSSDEKVRKAAELYLLHRATKSENLIYILQQSLSDDLDQVVKSVTVIRMMAKASEEYKAQILEARALMILPQCIGKISDDFKYKVLLEKIRGDVRVEKILHRCISALFQLVLHDTVSIITFSKESMLIRNILLNIIADESFQILTDTKRCSSYIITQLSQLSSHPIKKQMKKWGVIRKTCHCLMATAGDLLQIQFCLQIIVHYLNDPIDEIVKVCEEMALLGVVPHLVGLLRCDEDENIAQLAAVVIHHFCCFDIEIHFLSSVPGIVKILYTVLNSHEASIQKTIIRIANYLSVSSSKFQKMLIDHEAMIKKLTICMSSGNSDVVHGSLMLLHDLAMPGKQFAQKLVLTNPDVLKALVSLSLSSQGESVQLVAETLGFICSCESLHSYILKYDVVSAILHFAKNNDVAVQFWASALLLNLSMISDEIKNVIVRKGGIHTLLEMAVSEDEVGLPDIAVNATKTLVILGFLDTSIKVELRSGIDGSIIIDGTERCPGKQGINIVSLDFVHYKFSRGKVVQPENFQEFVKENVKGWKKSDPMFIVTQGDCTVLSDGPYAESLSCISHKKELFYAPSWCLIKTSDSSKSKYGTSNIDYVVDLPIGEFISVVLKENFSDPLIDVLLSMPPASNLNKVSELELIEILSRHTMQRRAIINTPGFLSFLHELIWVVASNTSYKLQESEPPTNVLHCLASLKILHSCSMDNECLKTLVNNGLIDVLAAFLLSLVPQINLVSDEADGHDLDHKAVWFDAIEPLDERDEGNGSNTGEDDDDDDAIFKTTLQGESASALISDNESEINEELSNLDFQSNQTTPFTTPYPRSSRNTDEISVPSTTPRRESSRRRADSFIVRSDSRQIHRGDSRAESFLENIVEGIRSERTVSGLDTHRPFSRASTSVSAEHQQLRRISRSMSVSMQQMKSANKDDGFQVMKFSDVMLQLLRHGVVIFYRIIQLNDSDIMQKVISSTVLPLVASLPSFLNTSKDHHLMDVRKRISLAVTASLMSVSQSFLQKSTEDENPSSSNTSNVIIKHATPMDYLVLSADRLTVSNENWYFGTVVANQSISKQFYSKTDDVPLGWYFELQVFNDGIMQIGIAEENCLFDGKKGVGVGDTIKSCGFDGARCKMWNGPSLDVMLENDYGIEWQAGDTIGVLLSWGGVLSYRMNGKDLGPALSNIDTTKIWYPALSLSVDQFCRFTFKRNDFSYRCPEGYETLEELHQRHFTRDDSNKVQIPTTVFSDLQFVDLVDVNKKEEFTGSSLCLYYEFDVSNFSEDIVRFGYMFASEVKKDQSVGNLFDEQVPEITTRKILKAIKRDSLHFVVGCGISLPQYSLIVTLNGEFLCERPLENISEDPKHFFNLIPFVDHKHLTINFGDEDFFFQIANSITIKFQCFEHISKLVDQME